MWPWPRDPRLDVVAQLVVGKHINQELIALQDKDDHLSGRKPAFVFLVVIARQPIRNAASRYLRVPRVVVNNSASGNGAVVFFTAGAIHVGCSLKRLGLPEKRHNLVKIPSVGANCIGTVPSVRH